MLQRMALQALVLIGATAVLLGVVYNIHKSSQLAESSATKPSAVEPVSPPPSNEAVASTPPVMSAPEPANLAAPVAEAVTALGASETASVAPQTQWVYAEESDAMDDAKTKQACVESENMVTLDWPYRPTTARLCVRRSPKFGLDVFVQLNGEGQIICGFTSCGARIRFDQAPARRIGGSEASDHSSNIIFLTGARKVVSSLKSAQKTSVELEFYKNGVQTLTFPTEGLVW